MRIGITLGDPLGIGPEVAFKALMKLRGESPVEPILYGESAVARRAAELAGWREPLPELISVKAGSDQPGRCAGEAIELATTDALAGKVAAIVTAPIHKGRLNQAGFRFPGHTEFLGALTKTPHPVMMFVAKGLKVSLVTIHEPLAAVSSMLTQEKIMRVTRETDKAMKNWFGIPRPRIAVAGFNPHAGEGGLLGREEETIIAPAVARLKEEGFEISGPHSPDTLFYRAAQGEFHAVVAMYHDQALIPVKLSDFHGAVNVTLGLPIIRTSPDHGTADDIAWKGVANPASMVAAIRLATQMAETAKAPPHPLGERVRRTQRMRRRRGGGVLGD